MITEPGAESLYHSWVVDVIEDGDTLCGVIVENKSGQEVILAKRIIDCTGGADVAARAGAPWTKRSKDQLMGITVTLSRAGADVARFNRFTAEELRLTYADWGKNWTIQTTGKEDPMFSPCMEDIFTRTQQDDMILDNAQAIAGTWLTFSESGKAFQMNMVHAFGLDCTDVFDLVETEIVGGWQALWVIDALRHYTPGFENVQLRNFNATLGTCESRLTKGEMRITDDYASNQGRCSDSVGIFPEFINSSGYPISSTTGRFFQIPYGCLVPQEVENLSVVGRYIPADVVVYASMRDMMRCAATGEAAGTAAVVSLQRNCTTRQVAIPDLQNTL